MIKDIVTQKLSEFIAYDKYARAIPSEGRKENWHEICMRYKAMMEAVLYQKCDFSPKGLRALDALKERLNFAVRKMLELDDVPSMRCLQHGGQPILKNNEKAFNCCYRHVIAEDGDTWQAFYEIPKALLNGEGVGYSVQKHHIYTFPAKEHNRRQTLNYVIADSIEDWANSFKFLVASMMQGFEVEFDYSHIRPKGSIIKSTYSLAPGPDKLKESHEQIKGVLSSLKEGDKLTPLNCHDIICYASDCVVAGGIRRSALISLFSFDDNEMMNCKMPENYSYDGKNQHRGRANNSCVILIDDPIFEFKIRSVISLSTWGEPGIFLTNSYDLGTNPCAEIGLVHKEKCNLTSANVATGNYQSIVHSLEVSAIMGTLQAQLDYYPTLSKEWHENTVKERLLGCSMTGIVAFEPQKAIEHLPFPFNVSTTQDDYDAFFALGKYSAEINKEITDLLTDLTGVKQNYAARVTTVKPEGTTSLVLGTSSGVHPYPYPYYIRNVSSTTHNPAYQVISKIIPELCRVKVINGEVTDQTCISFPIKAPAGAKVAGEYSALDQLNLVKNLRGWIDGGHRSGENKHNVSVSVYYTEEDKDQIINWLIENREFYHAISLSPLDASGYGEYAPNQQITEAEYEHWFNYFSERMANFDFATIHNPAFNALEEIIACAGGVCEIN